MSDAPSTTDLPHLIVRLWEAWDDTCSELHDDPRIGPIVARGKEKYREERRHGFERASIIAREQAIRELICQETSNA